ncbi:MAG: NAD-binding protein, partial [Holophagales bacterium]|nr:NAD-binding protein [Holophagales bacterium]
LIRRLVLNRIPYVLIEPDPVRAAHRKGEGISVIAGDLDSRATYEALRVGSARMVFANAEDTTNTNIILTARALDARVPILALAEDEDSIDIYQLSGATEVLPLKRRLGESLAARVSSGAGAAHVVGQFEDLQIAEFLVHGTELVGKSLKDLGLRERTGVNVVAIWEEGHLQPVDAERPLSASAVPVAVGNREQVKSLDRMLQGDRPSLRPVLVIGGGKVGRATAAALETRGLEVRVVEKNPALRPDLERHFSRVTIGDAADRSVLAEAGLEEAGAVALTTNSDAVNIHLAVYCRRLKPGLSLVSRITHERNIEAIYRAGVDSALSYSSLGREHLVARLLGREPVMVGEGADFFRVPIPESLVGKTLGESQIGARTGLIVIGLENGEGMLTNPPATAVLEPGRCLLMLGTSSQREGFARRFR